MAFADWLEATVMAATKAETEVEVGTEVVAIVGGNGIVRLSTATVEVWPCVKKYNCVW